jgi:RNA polymerase sigma-70 factor, ECF subfamily
LVEAARQGNHEAFKALVIKYESQVAATIVGMLGYGNEAEDIGQETFMRFYKSLKQFKGESSVGTYLTRIAINLSINELKRRQRRNKFFHLSEPVIEMESLPAGYSQLNPSHKDEELKVIIHQALQQLEPRFRSVIVLRLIDGYSTQETAQILKLPSGTVLSRLARAQMKLKKILTAGSIPGRPCPKHCQSFLKTQKKTNQSVSPEKDCPAHPARVLSRRGKNDQK